MTNFVGSVIKGVQCLVLRGIATFVLLLCCTQWATAQIQVEYFWNKDNGLGKCTRVGGEARVGGELTFALPTDTLPYGVNLLGVRAFVESDTATYWSPTLYSYIAKPLRETQVREIEYFWDNDPGLGNATKVAGGTAKVGESLSFSIPTDTLAPGVHRLGVRAKDVGWSPTLYSYIAKPLPETLVREVEYFWDNDPGLGNATKVAGGTAKVGESLSFSIPTDTLAPGVHRLGVRAKDVGWSPTVYRLVAVKANGPESCAQYIEYFWDKDPGFGNGMREELQPNAAGNTVSFEVSTAGLTNGVHTLYARTKAIGWSPLVCYYVRVQDSEVQVIDDIEYFWDEDPGYGYGIKVPFEQGSSVDIKDFEPDVEGMSGEHMFCLRAHSAGGWSVIYSGKVLLAAEGTYTLDNTLPVGMKRNFVSLDEFFVYVDTMKVVSDITLNVVDGGCFVMDLRGDSAKALLDKAESLFVGGGHRLELKAKSSALIDVQVNSEDVINGLELNRFIFTDNVILRINNAAFDFELLNYRSDEVCAGGLTESREWSTMSSLLDVQWYLTSGGNGKIEGALSAGTGDLPSMTLYNNSLYTDSVCYTVKLMYNGVEFNSFNYNILVRPSLGEQELEFLASNPASGSVVNPGTVNLSWTKVDAWATYQLEVETVSKSDGTVVRDTVRTASNSYALVVNNGYSYNYRVKAVSPCDSSAYVASHFTAFDIDNDDWAAMRQMYDCMGGDGWSRRWLFDEGDYSSLYYQGVTFNADDKVSTINLEGNNLVGHLPSQGASLPGLKELKLKNNRLTGDIAAFVNGCAMLESVDVSYNSITEISSPLGDNVKTLVLTNQFRTSKGGVAEGLDSLPLNDILMNTSRVDGLVASSVAWYVHSTRSFNAHPLFRVWDRNLKVELGEMVYSGDCYKLNIFKEYNQEQGAAVLLEVGSGDAKGSLYPGRLNYVEGDANIDGRLDITDVQHLLNYVVGPNGAHGAFNCSASNVYADEYMNVQDVVAMVNRLLRSRTVGKQNSKSSFAVNAINEIDEARAALYIADGKIVLSAECEVAAMDIELAGVKRSDVVMMTPDGAFDIVSVDTDAGCRLVIMSLTGETLPVGVSVLMSVGDDAAIVDAMAADIAAKAIRLMVNNGNVTSVGDVYVPKGIVAGVGNDGLYINTPQRLDNVCATLYSVDGRSLYSNRGLQLLVGNNVLDTGLLNSGVYLLELILEDGKRIVMRVVVNK